MVLVSLLLNLSINFTPCPSVSIADFEQVNAEEKFFLNIDQIVGNKSSRRVVGTA